MSSHDVLQWVVGVGVGAILVELIRSFVQRKKMGADAAKVITDAATVLLEPLQRRVRELEEEVDKTRKQLTEAREEVAEATEALQAAHREVVRLRDLLSEKEKGPSTGDV